MPRVRDRQAWFLPVATSGFKHTWFKHIGVQHAHATQDSLSIGKAHASQIASGHLVWFERLSLKLAMETCTSVRRRRLVEVMRRARGRIIIILNFGRWAPSAEPRACDMIIVHTYPGRASAGPRTRFTRPRANPVTQTLTKDKDKRRGAGWIWLGPSAAGAQEARRDKALQVASTKKTIALWPGSALVLSVVTHTGSRGGSTSIGRAAASVSCFLFRDSCGPWGIR
ncbi:hypothetical protein B0H15DRAFT_964504 [Mycena belliarum]|uniref:Uncharacterized protein n=1 Tax=Mycena belliarum TaxID=1033014 RepID=A0AAD6UA43_9AGAR|nr:hypothetical protein B0H15DRAFT_964504 [Mycena belliae]